MRKRSAVAIPVLLALAVTAGCTRTVNSGAVPADPAPPCGLVLRLEPARTPAGGLVTLRIDGPSAAASTMGVDADFQRWNGSTWRTEYLLDAWGAGTSRPDVFPAGELHFIVGIGLVGTQPLSLKVPPVEPGEYRIAKEVTREGPAAQRQVTLYARLRVTG
jgi:hypothetical protein